MELDLWLDDRLVARTQARDRNRKVRVVYDDRVVTAYGDEVSLLSCSLPTPGPSTPSDARSFLEGLLPEGRALETMASQVRGVRLQGGAPETPADVVALLAEYGRECAGAVAAMPAGSERRPAGSYQSLDDDGLDAAVRDLPRHPLGNDRAREIRMSLAGAQPKLLLAQMHGRWLMPVDGAASTHIIKPTTRWPNSAENEALVMNLARALGLTDRETWTEAMGDTVVLVAERYDRTIRNGRVVRFHQEDMCQALGIRPVDKHSVGRPSGRMARALREFTTEPRAEVRRLFEQVAFRAVVGDEDGHGKNYSLLLTDGAVTLAPLYDSLCTLVYPELSGRMAARIGPQESLAKVDRAALIDEGRAMGLASDEVGEILDSLAERLDRALGGLAPQRTSGWPAERVADKIAQRVERLRTGKPLGHAQGARSRPLRTFDAATLE